MPALGTVVQPVDIATDSRGDIYFRNDRNHPRLFELPANGNSLRWVAGSGAPGDAGDGGYARQAQLASSGAMAVDDTGDVYLADAAKHQVREIVEEGGEMVGFAGNGARGWSGDGGPATKAELYRRLAGR